jgi:hypothetical protein
MSGRRLAGDYVCLFAEYRGDWEWTAETFQWRLAINKPQHDSNPL